MLNVTITIVVFIKCTDCTCNVGYRYKYIIKSCNMKLLLIKTIVSYCIGCYKYLIGDYYDCVLN